MTTTMGEFSDYQKRVGDWMGLCFPPAVARDVPERCHRFVEEALELVQAAGCGKADVLRLVDYVYARPVGVLRQEVGGVMVTLAALCNATNASIEMDGEAELARCWCHLDKIRAKWEAKEKGSPLPQPPKYRAVQPGDCVATVQPGGAFEMVATGNPPGSFVVRVRYGGLMSPSEESVRIESEHTDPAVLRAFADLFHAIRASAEEGR